MRGLRLRFAADESQMILFDIDPVQQNSHPLHLAMQERLIENVPLQMSEDKIRDKSKASWLAKSVLFGQLSYFLAQLIGRWVQQLAVTPLELLTLGIVVSIAVAYAAWWYKPFDVEVPTEVTVDPSKFSFNPLDDLCVETETGSAGGSQRSAWNGAVGVYLQDLPETLRTEARSNIQKRNFENLVDECGFPTIMSLESVEKVLWESRPHGGQAPELEDWKAYARKVRTLISVRHAQRWQTVVVDRRGVLDHTVPPIGLGITSLLFGSCHLVGWYFEVLLWRVASVLCITYSVLNLLVSLLLRSPGLGDNTEAILIIMFSALPVVYAVARLYLIVAVFISFRSMPASAFTRVDWTLYIPRIG